VRESSSRHAAAAWLCDDLEVCERVPPSMCERIPLLAKIQVFECSSTTPVLQSCIGVAPPNQCDVLPTRTSGHVSITPMYRDAAWCTIASPDYNDRCSIRAASLST